jgi:phage I-like protein
MTQRVTTEPGMTGIASLWFLTRVDTSGIHPELNDLEITMDLRRLLCGLTRRGLTRRLCSVAAPLW